MEDSPTATTSTRLLLAILGVEPSLPPDNSLETIISTGLRYNAGWTLLHFGSCLLMHVLLSVGLKLNLFATTGPVRPITVGFIAYFCFVDFVTNIILSVFYVGVTLPSAVPWSYDNPGVIETGVAIFSLQILQDLLHYPMHRFLHSTKNEWLREMHRCHHREAKTTIAMNCFDLMNLHPLEYWLTIMPAYVAGFWLSYTVPIMLGFSPNFFGCHFAPFFTFTIECLGHSNVDLPVPIVMQWLGFTGCSDHAMHHLNANSNFGIFFTFLDRIFGTYKPYSPVDISLPAKSL
jgi:sterol desaturase/sphingolipid hydroxylase (fatty acid hydroxylase superfamily)